MYLFIMIFFSLCFIINCPRLEACAFKKRVSNGFNLATALAALILGE